MSYTVAENRGQWRGGGTHHPHSFGHRRSPATPATCLYQSKKPTHFLHDHGWGVTDPGHGAPLSHHFPTIPCIGLHDTLTFSPSWFNLSVICVRSVAATFLLNLASAASWCEVCFVFSSFHAFHLSLFSAGDLFILCDVIFSVLSFISLCLSGRASFISAGIYFDNVWLCSKSGFIDFYCCCLGILTAFFMVAEMRHFLFKTCCC